MSLPCSIPFITSKNEAVVPFLWRERYQLDWGIHIIQTFQRPCPHIRPFWQNLSKATSSLMFLLLTITNHFFFPNHFFITVSIPENHDILLFLVLILISNCAYTCFFYTLSSLTSSIPLSPLSLIFIPIFCMSAREWGGRGSGEIEWGQKRCFCWQFVVPYIYWVGKS